MALALGPIKGGAAPRLQLEGLGEKSQRQELEENAKQFARAAGDWRRGREAVFPREKAICQTRRWHVQDRGKKEMPVVYCISRQCEDSSLVATRFSQLGYESVLIFEGGWAEWWKRHR